jgi:2-polyprenyl-3-methyl-5-hydroxy-6-metoxy-1,4-benzoquinol methylase
MDPLEVAASYDLIAERWCGSQFDRSNGVRQHERALSFAPRSGAALDVGCGCSGRFIDLLGAHGYQVEGLDLSGEMVRLAQIRHPQVTFHHADIRSWPLRQAYDFISAWDSVWHVPLGQQRDVLLKLCGGLARDGVFIFSAGGLESPNERRDQAMGVPMYHATIGVPRIAQVIREAGCILRHFEYDQFPQEHVFFIVQRA